MKLSEMILDAIDGATETRGRDSMYTEWAEHAERLEAQARTVKEWDERDSKAIDYYSCLRLDADATASFIADTYSDWDTETEWCDYLDQEMDRFMTTPHKAKPEPTEPDPGQDWERPDPAMDDWEAAFKAMEPQP